MKSFTGYYNYGSKFGKGIQLKPIIDADNVTPTKMAVQAEGIWKGNQMMVSVEKIEAFTENE